VLALAGLVLGFAYVGSFRAIYGTSYGAMVATKALLFGILLFLGALNFQLVRRGPASSILASLKRFGEAELGIGITVILTAASLTSLPPAADLIHDRVTGTEIIARMSPQSPRFASPSVQELPEDAYVAQKRAFEVGSLSTESYVPGQTGTRPNTPAEKAWSEYNHHWAGIVVLSMGLLALAAQAGIAGSTRIGKDVMLGGRVGIINHLNIGDGAQIGPGSGILRSVPPGVMRSSGLDAPPHREWLKVITLLPQLPRLWTTVRHLEKKVSELVRLCNKET